MSRQDCCIVGAGPAGMYVADPRFAANYGGDEGATFVRQALEHYAEARL